MQSFKANLIIIFFIVIILGLAFWAMGSLKSSTSTLAEENLKEDVRPIITSEPEPNVSTPTNEPTAISTPTPEPEVVVAHSALIAEIQKLIDEKVLMKKGSKGTRVGVVQEFLIEYGINMKEDNDYGDTTVNAIKKFQSEQGLSADGQTGEGTYKKMIEWLKAN